MAKIRTKAATAGRVILTAKVSEKTDKTLTQLSGLETQLTGVKTAVNRVIDLLVAQYGEQHLAQGRSISSGLDSKTK